MTVALHTARLVVYGIGKMSGKELTRFVGWLRKLADDIEKQPELYSNGRFVGRFF